MSLVRIRMGAVQASAVEINVTDPAHDDEREDWWPVVDGAWLTFDATRADAVALLLVDAANAEDGSAEQGADASARKDARAARDALAALASRVRRS